MAADFIPTNDLAFEDWAQNFSQIITADPVVLGLTAGIATTLAGKLTSYSSAVAAATAGPTRGESTIHAKDVARDDLEKYCRQLARMIQGQITVTDQQRVDLRLPVRDVHPSPRPAPDAAPGVQIVQVNGRSVLIRLSDAATGRHAKPANVDGANVFSFIGPTPPAPEDVSAWNFEGTTSRTKFVVNFPSSVANGTTVWLTAYWFNERKQSGPGAQPIPTVIQGSVSMSA